MKNIAKLGLLMCLCLSLSACFSFGGGDEEEVYEVDGSPHLYIIDVDRGAVAEEFVRNRVLLLKPVRVVPHFRGKQMVFRVGDNEYKPLAGHQFFSTPSEMFTDQLRRWLQKSGLFSQVIVDESGQADYVLEAAVTALYADKRQAYSPQSALEMQFFLTLADDTTQAVAFQTGLRVDVDLQETTPTNAVIGWKQGLTELLATLEQDLSAYFAKLDTQ